MAAVTARKSSRRLLVVLFEGHDLCCSMQQGEVDLRYVRPGNKVGSVAGLRSLVRRQSESFVELLLSLSAKLTNS
jgi:hypothetical protein